MSGKQLIIYSGTKTTSELANFPWDGITFLNHAFWKIGGGDGDYYIEPCDADIDLGTNGGANIFAYYSEVYSQHPNVNFMISLGGAVHSNLFSELAVSATGRASLIASCMDTLERYPFLAGIDIDWEFPMMTMKSGGVVTSKRVGNDWRNYTLLVKEMRQAFDQKFGVGVQKITACTAAVHILADLQNFRQLHKYLDFINIMTYDLGYNKRKAGHHSAIYGGYFSNCVASAVRIFAKKKVPKSKTIIGSPLYSRGASNLVVKANGNVIGSPCNHNDTDAVMSYNKIAVFESQSVPVGEAGWHMGYDAASKAAYIWNDDKDSEYSGYYMSYESIRSLDDKLQYIVDNDLAGLIVWVAGGDIAEQGYPMIRHMGDKLVK